MSFGCLFVFHLNLSAQNGMSWFDIQLNRSPRTVDPSRSQVSPGADLRDMNTGAGEVCGITTMESDVIEDRNLNIDELTGSQWS